MSYSSKFRSSLPESSSKRRFPDSTMNGNHLPSTKPSCDNCDDSEKTFSTVQEARQMSYYDLSTSRQFQPYVRLVRMESTNISTKIEPAKMKPAVDANIKNPVTLSKGLHVREKQMKQKLFDIEAPPKWDIKKSKTVEDEKSVTNRDVEMNRKLGGRLVRDWVSDGGSISSDDLPSKAEQRCCRKLPKRKSAIRQNKTKVTQRPREDFCSLRAKNNYDFHDRLHDRDFKINDGASTSNASSITDNSENDQIFRRSPNVIILQNILLCPGKNKPQHIYPSKDEVVSFEWHAPTPNLEALLGDKNGVHYTIPVFNSLHTNIRVGYLKVDAGHRKSVNVLTDCSMLCFVERGEISLRMNYREDVGQIGSFFFIPRGMKCTITSLKTEDLILKIVKMSPV